MDDEHELLAGRCEQAFGADRELDLDCWWWGKANGVSTKQPMLEDYRQSNLRMNDAPRYTSSIDAALTLVPDGGRWFKCGVNDPKTSAAEVRMFVCGPQDENGKFHISGGSLTDETRGGDARAICAAAFRALAQENKS